MTTNRENEINCAYEQAVAEIGTGAKRSGIQARALVESQENGKDVETVYLRLLAQQILEENTATNRKARRDVVLASSAAAVGGITSWLKHWLGLSAAALILLAIIGLMFGFQLLEVTIPSSGNWGFEGKLGGALGIGGVLFGASAFMLICMFMLLFFRRKWIVASLIALIPVPFLLQDVLSGAKATAELESRTNKPNSLVNSNSRGETAAPTSGSNSGQDEFDNLLKEYERKYPQINPDSPSVDEALILRISARMKKLMSGGTDVKVALVNSVEHELTTSPGYQKQDEYPLERFLANGDGTVTDTQTKLVWANSDTWPDSDKTPGIGWDDAKKYCAEKGSGWSLPTVMQLQSLYDEKYTQPCRTEFFTCRVTPLIRLSNYWMWSSEADGASAAWAVFMMNRDRISVTTQFGGSKGLRGLCVRGY